MYHPTYTITPRTLNHIAAIAAGREMILSSRFVPKVEIQLRRGAVLTMTHHSTSIEGNRLTKEEVGRMLAGEDVPARERDKQEVLGYTKAIEYIDRLGEKGADTLTEESILAIHRLIMTGTLKDENRGRYRTIWVAVVDGEGRMTFQPPEASEVPRLMKGLIHWLNSGDAMELDPVLASGIAHYEFVRIHPFVDGNGRTARVLATLILYLRGFDPKRIFALDEYYNEDRERYYSTLESVDPGTQDLTRWLEYFTEGVAVNIEKLKRTILDLNLDMRISGAGADGRDPGKDQIFLNERQVAILKHLQTNPRITSDDIRTMFDISRDTVSRDLRPMIAHDLIRKGGKGRGIYYELA